MKRLVAALAITATPALSCDRAVCLSAEPIRLAQVITFDDQRSAPGPGHPVTGLLSTDGAEFGEMFAGQSLLVSDEVFDAVTGTASAPLTLLAGPENQNLSILRLPASNVLSGDGPRGFPRHDATGEGAVSILFAQDHAALRLDLMGGEGGTLTVLFLRRDGTLIDVHEITNLTEGPLYFARRDASEDIAGVTLWNRDPEGIALDGVAFGSATQTSKAPFSPQTFGPISPE